MSTPIRTELPGKPEKAVDFALPNGKYARVVYQVKGNDGNTMHVEFQAFEVDAKGVLQAAPNGAASRTPSQTTEVHLSGCRGPFPTMTLKAGWVCSPPPHGALFDNDLVAPEKCTLGSGPPPADLVGDMGHSYYDKTRQTYWTWHPGALEGPIMDKAIELQTILDNSDVLTDFTL